jgi:membrane-associated protease RseP (regulator of RpoE activity)
MLELLGILILALLIGLSIGLHEIGHMVPAKKFGVKVTEYAIGFGPTVFSRTKGETDYRIRLLPVGGFIRMIGMFAPSRADGRVVGGRFAQAIADARTTSAEEIGPNDDARAFYRLSVPKKLVVMTGGPLMNLVIASVLFGVIFTVIGFPTTTSTTGYVVQCVPTESDPSGEGTIAGCVDSSITPAVTAGFKPGDKLLSIDGLQISKWEDFQTGLDGKVPGDQVAITVNTAAGETQTRTVELAKITYPEYDVDGNLTGKTITRGFVGLGPAYEYVSQPISDVPPAMWALTTRSISAILSFPQKIYTLVAGMVSGQDRDPNGPVSVVGVSRLSGEIAASDQPFKEKASMILGMAASLNLFLFLFNLLPLLPLDGGHAAGAIFEGLRRTLARLRRKADPGPIDLARMLPITYVMTAVLLITGVVVIFADLVDPISLLDL